MRHVLAMSQLVAVLAVFGTACMAAPESEEGGQSEDPEVAADEQVETREDAVCSCAVEKVCAHQVTVYEHSDCCGGWMYFCPGDYSNLGNITTNLGWGANWNDRISIVSTWGDKHVKAIVYQHAGFGGDSKTIPPGTWKNLGGSLWNDQISSIKVRYVP